MGKRIKKKKITVLMNRTIVIVSLTFLGLEKAINVLCPFFK